MKHRKAISLVLFAALISSFSACGEGATDDVKETTGGVESADQTETYPDYEGYKFRVLNFDTYFSSYIRVGIDEATGDILDDAVYNRNRKIEQLYGFELEEVTSPYAKWQTDQVALMDRLQNSVMAGDDDFDAAYVQPYFKPSVLTDGYLADLATIPELKLDEVWWDHAVNESFTINDKLYAATGALQFMPLESVWVLLFNESMMDELKLEYPYQLVRDGKWTLDKFYEYAQAGTRLNGDESFDWNENGNATYGIAGHTSIPPVIVYCSDYRFVKKSGSEYTAELASEKLFDCIEKAKKLFDQESGIAHVNNNTGDDTGGYLNVFRNRRALFVTAGLSAVSEYRDMNDPYGLVPFPKYDEAQKDYISQAGVSIQMLAIPATQKDMSRTGTILEALTKESYESVMPVYYGVRVEQKGLRNDDSIEMLKIIRDNYGLESAQVLGVTSGYIGELTKVVTNQGDNIASLAAEYTERVKTNLSKLIAAFD